MEIYWYVACSKNFVFVLPYICVYMNISICVISKLAGMETEGRAVPSGLWFTIYNYKVVAQIYLLTLFAEYTYSCMFHTDFFCHISFV